MTKVLSTFKLNIFLIFFPITRASSKFILSYIYIYLEKLNLAETPIAYSSPVLLSDQREASHFSIFLQLAEALWLILANGILSRNYVYHFRARAFKSIYLLCMTSFLFWLSIKVEPQDESKLYLWVTTWKTVSLDGCQALIRLCMNKK